MKFCEKHWGDLRLAITIRGMAGFVSPDGEEAVRRVHAAAALVPGSPLTADSFDPLIGAALVLADAFCEDAGPAAAAFDGCFLCEVAKQTPGLDAEWLTGAVDDQAAEARRAGLLKVQ